MFYKTSQISKMIGVHPNTIRFYEQIALLPVIPREKNGYRVFNDRHVLQLQLLRAAFRAEIISSRLRNEAYEIVKTSAADDILGAYTKTQEYYNHLAEETSRAEEAITIVTEIIKDSQITEDSIKISKRKDAAVHIGVTTDILRDWERNGLIAVPRDGRGYRQYGAREINRLKIIRTLRNAHYSMMAILRMLRRLDNGEMNIKKSIDTPDTDEDIISATDMYISALYMAQKDALNMMDILKLMR